MAAMLSMTATLNRTRGLAHDAFDERVVVHFQLRFGGGIVNGLPLACTDVQYFRFNFLFKHNIYFFVG